jgi:hypothetical protein
MIFFLLCTSIFSGVLKEWSTMKASKYHYHSTMNDFLKLEFAQLKKESSTKPNPQRETSDLKAEAIWASAQWRCFTYNLIQGIYLKSQRRDYYIDKHLATHHKFDC